MYQFWSSNRRLILDKRRVVIYRSSSNVIEGFSNRYLNSVIEIWFIVYTLYPAESTGCYTDILEWDVLKSTEIRHKSLNISSKLRDMEWNELSEELIEDRNDLNGVIRAWETPDIQFGLIAVYKISETGMVADDPDQEFATQTPDGTDFFLKERDAIEYALEYMEEQ